MTDSQVTKDFKVGLNQKIVFHWFIVTIIIGLLISLISSNPVFVSVLIGLFLLTLGLNSSSFISISNGILIITKRKMIFFKTYQKTIDLSKIENLTIQDLGPQYPRKDLVTLDYFPSMINLFTGFYFYQPRFLIKIVFLDSEVLELKVNTQKMDIKRLSKKLKALLTTRFEYKELNLNRVENIKNEMIENE